MRLRFTAETREHIAEIYGYIGDRSPAAATQVAARIRLAAERLTEFPKMGRTGRVAGTHEWVVHGLPYIIVYEIGTTDPNEVVILGVFHAAQDREPQ
ncbi:MAG TPA: type II toxin-antitoxin system RelE/ParE family toxin [Bradyrhizobium sp.]|jgi:toxin ParE1/3/4|nr:type II toxin-antitoxin system RelE/ParE family toxin [Bradyrhizobium sp.]